MTEHPANQALAHEHAQRLVPEDRQLVDLVSTALTVAGADRAIIRPVC
jgi:hypothetical protein